MLLHLGIDRVFVAMNGIHQHGSLFIIFGWLPRPGNLVVLCTRGSTPSRPWLCFFKRVCVCVLDRFCCGAAFILISIAQPSRRFVRVKSMSPWRGAGVLAQRS